MKKARKTRPPRQSRPSVVDEASYLTHHAFAYLSMLGEIAQVTEASQTEKRGGKCFNATQRELTLLKSMDLRLMESGFEPPTALPQIGQEIRKWISAGNVLARYSSWSRIQRALLSTLELTSVLDDSSKLSLLKNYYYSALRDRNFELCRSIIDQLFTHDKDSSSLDSLHRLSLQLHLYDQDSSEYASARQSLVETDAALVDEYNAACMQSLLNAHEEALASIKEWASIQSFRFSSQQMLAAIDDDPDFNNLNKTHRADVVQIP